MAVSPALDQALSQLQQQLCQMQNRITQLERNQRTAQLGHSTVVGGSLTFADSNGNPQLIAGLQPDGTYTTVSVTNNSPPQPPDQPLAGPGVLSIWCYWDGLMADGTAPLADFDHVEVHCSATEGFIPGQTTLQGTMSKAGLFGVGNLTGGTLYYVIFVAVNQAGLSSSPSLEAQATAGVVTANIAPGSITAAELQTGTITAAQIAANAQILGSQLADNTISAANIVAGTITASLLAAGIVATGIVDGTTVNAATFNGSTFNGSNWTENDLGQFLYSGSPALGNLIASITRSQGNEGLGNDFYPGMCVYVPSGGAAPAYVAQMWNGAVSFGPNSAFLGTGGAAASTIQGTTNGTLRILSGSSVSGDTQGSLQVTSLQGSGTNMPAMIFNGAFAPTAVNLIPSNAGPYLYALGSGSLGYKANNYAGTLPVTLIDTTQRTVTGTSMSRIANLWSYPANDAAKPGTAYRLKVYGKGTTGSSANELCVGFFGMGMPQPGANMNIGTTFMANSTNFSWAGEWIIVVLSNSTCCIAGWMNMSVYSGVAFTGTPLLPASSNSPNASCGFAGQDTAIAIDTTTTSNMTIQAGWRTNTGAPTITCFLNTLERISP